MNTTNKHLFFTLLGEARRLKNVLGWDWKVRQGYLLGMMRMYLISQDNIRESQINMSDFGYFDVAAGQREE